MVKMSQHWPFITLLIIAFLTTCSFYCALHAFPPKLSESNKLYCMFLMSSVAMTLYFFFACMISEPGFVPQQWKPFNDADRQHLEFCKMCAGYKPPRSHHCRRCNRCIKRMDHHCPFINNCVGYSNHSMFLLCIFFAFLSIAAGIVPVSVVLWRFHDDHGRVAKFIDPLGYKILIFAEILLLLVGSGVASLVFAQAQGIWTNQTYIEKLLSDVAEDTQRPFRNPYNIGVVSNFADIMGCFQPLFNERGEEGVDFPIREGTQKYIYQILRRTLMGGGAAPVATNQARSTTMASNTVKENPPAATAPLVKVFVDYNSKPLPQHLKPTLDVRAGEKVMVYKKKGNWLYGQRHKSKHMGWFPESSLRKEIRQEA